MTTKRRRAAGKPASRRKVSAGRLRIGTSGYQYDHWRGRFYPDDLPKKRWFEHYAAHFDTVEINNTFYRLPGPHVFESWRKAAPQGFCYAVKFSRFGSHMKKLKDAPDTIQRFLEAADRLGKTFGPVLVHLPPRWKVDHGRLEEFLGAAPRRVRWAFEFRDRSWLCEEIYETLAAHRAALCIHDMLADHPWRLTSGWTYLRYHGPTPGGPYARSYSPQKLAADARRIAGLLAEGHDVYAYFNNDVDAHAVANAQDLRRRVERRRASA